MNPTLSFQLDTSGKVSHPDAAAYRTGASLAATYWPDLSPFVQGYTAAVLEAANAPYSALAPETLSRIMADCSGFENFTSGLGFKTGRVEGERFWNGRQSGSLAGAWGAAFPPLTVSLNDAGKVVFS